MSQDLRRAAEEHFQRGNSFDENGYGERAIAEWQEATHLDPDHAGAHYNLAIAYADDREIELAINEFREALRIDPFDTDARRELAEVYLEADRSDEAVNQLRQTLNIAPGDAQAAHRLAGIYFDQGMIDQAAAALESGAMDEQDAELWYQLGKAYEKEGRRDDAILAFRRALISSPGYHDAEHTLQLMHVPIEEQPDEEELE